MPNRIAVTGHTAVRRARRPAKSPWDLSAGRAISVREILALNGLPDDRFATVAGKADTDPMFPDNPYLAANRRVTITLLNERRCASTRSLTFPPRSRKAEQTIRMDPSSASLFRRPPPARRQRRDAQGRDAVAALSEHLEAEAVEREAGRHPGWRGPRGSRGRRWWWLPRPGRSQSMARLRSRIGTEPSTLTEPSGCGHALDRRRARP